MWGLIILGILAVLVLIISKRNYKNRATSLYNNFNDFNLLIKDKYNNLGEDEKKLFLSSLEKDLYLFFTNVILNDSSKKLPTNTWSIQQQMIKQEEIMKKFKSFSN